MHLFISLLLGFVAVILDHAVLCLITIFTALRTRHPKSLMLQLRQLVIMIDETDELLQQPTKSLHKSSAASSLQKECGGSTGTTIVVFPKTIPRAQWASKRSESLFRKDVHAKYCSSS
ncbi:hypothetical protein C8R45DRAFT_945260 [Mycena sanguinolenta]|nr:hypothetical protein C8R45DRAFT_945260 [Mycena sanguinolenta]